MNSGKGGSFENASGKLAGLSGGGKSAGLALSSSFDGGPQSGSTKGGGLSELAELAELRGGIRGSMKRWPNPGLSCALGFLNSASGFLSDAGTNAELSCNRTVSSCSSTGAGLPEHILSADLQSAVNANSRPDAKIHTKAAMRTPKHVVLLSNETTLHLGENEKGLFDNGNE